MDILLSQVTARVPHRSAPLFTIPSLRIPSGSRILLQGPSGKGKTTLLHLLAGQFLPDQGTIQVGDQNLATLDHDARCRMRRKYFGIVFQRLNLLDHLNALENVLLGQSDFPPDSKKRGQTALEAMGLGSQATQRCASMSLGEQQRVAIARVLAAAPDIILADEPTSSLDQVNAENVMKALCEAATGKTLVVVSHDQRIQSFFATVLDFSAWVAA